MQQDKIAVLVVEDEQLIRMDIAGQLEHRGFEVFEAGGAMEAIAILDTTPGINVLFTDIDMPGGMDGLMLADAVKERWPLIEIIVTSGHWEMRDQDLPVVGKFFQKPYSPDLVEQEIRTLVMAAQANSLPDG